MRRFVNVITLSIVVGVSAAPLGAQVSITVPGRKDFTLSNDCQLAVNRSDASTATIELCRAALEATDQEPAADLSDRRDVRIALGNAYLLAEQWANALSAYQAAQAIAAKPDLDDARAGEFLADMALAYMLTGDLEAADRNATAALPRMEAAMAAHPTQRSRYVESLRTLYEFARLLKLRLGDVAGAAAIERKAAALGIRQGR